MMMYTNTLTNNFEINFTFVHGVLPEFLPDVQASAPSWARQIPASSPNSQLNELLLIVFGPESMIEHVIDTPLFYCCSGQGQIMGGFLCQMHENDFIHRESESSHVCRPIQGHGDISYYLKRLPGELHRYFGHKASASFPITGYQPHGSRSLF